MVQDVRAVGSQAYRASLTGPMTCKIEGRQFGLGPSRPAEPRPLTNDGCRLASLKFAAGNTQKL